MATSSNTAAPSPVLSLSTVLTRQRVEIDGTLFELRHVDELSWLVYRGHAETYRKAGMLLHAKDRSPEQEAQLDAILPGLMRVLLIAPDEVLDRLNNEQRFAIATVFSLPLLAKTTPAQAGRRAAAAPRPRRSTTRTGARSSRG